MNSVGAILRTERERQKREIAEISKELCITQRNLRAIERDDLQSLPGRFFYKSFVKQYAAILHVDEALLSPAINASTGAFDPLLLPGADPPYPNKTGGAKVAENPPLRHLDPIVLDENRRYFQDTRIGLPLVALVGMVLATSCFYAWFNTSPQSVSSPMAQVEMPATPASSPDAAPVKAEAPATTPTTTAPSIDVATATGADGENHVVLNLSATEETWLQITSDGKQVFSGVLKPSQTKTLTGLEVAKMKVGNAGGLEVRWNGKPIGPIGPRGQVRVVLFTPDNFQILAASQTL